MLADAVFEVSSETSAAARVAAQSSPRPWPTGTSPVTPRPTDSASPVLNDRTPSATPPPNSRITPQSIRAASSQVIARDPPSPGRRNSRIAPTSAATGSGIIRSSARFRALASPRAIATTPGTIHNASVTPQAASVESLRGRPGAEAVLLVAEHRLAAGDLADPGAAEHAEVGGDVEEQQHGRRHADGAPLQERELDPRDVADEPQPDQVRRRADRGGQPPHRRGERGHQHHARGVPRPDRGAILARWVEQEAEDRHRDRVHHRGRGRVRDPRRDERGDGAEGEHDPSRPRPDPRRRQDRERQPAVEPVQEQCAGEDERPDEQEHQRVGERLEDLARRVDPEQHARRRAGQRRDGHRQRLGDPEDDDRRGDRGEPVRLGPQRRQGPGEHRRERRRGTDQPPDAERPGPVAARRRRRWRQHPRHDRRARPRGARRAGHRRPSPSARDARNAASDRGRRGPRRRCDCARSSGC